MIFYYYFLAFNWKYPSSNEILKDWMENQNIGKKENFTVIEIRNGNYQISLIWT